MAFNRSIMVLLFLEKTWLNQLITILYLILLDIFKRIIAHNYIIMPFFVFLPQVVSITEEGVNLKYSAEGATVQGLVPKASKFGKKHCLYYYYYCYYYYYYQMKGFHIYNGSSPY